MINETPSERLRVAVVGAGYTAREHIRAFTDLPEVEVVGIHSRTRARAEALAREYGIPAVCDSVRDLFQQTRAGAAVVTVNELSMPEVSMACFEHPWAVLLEKPPGLTVEAAEAIRAGANSKGREVRVALNRQSFSVTEEVRKALAGVPGRRIIKVQDQEDPERALDAGRPREVVENWMCANSIHMVDYFRLFARGKAVSICPIIPWDPATRPCVMYARIDFSSGDVGLYEAVWNGPGPWAVTVTVDGQRWELRPMEQGMAQKRGAPPVALQSSPWDVQFKPGFRRQAEAFVHLAKGGSCDLPRLDEAIQTMKLIAALYPQPWRAGMG